MPEPKRELIEPHEGDRRYIRRDDEGKFTEDQVEVGRSIAQDMRRQAENKAERGHGDKGDHNVRQDSAE